MFRRSITLPRAGLAILGVGSSLLDCQYVDRHYELQCLLRMPTLPQLRRVHSALRQNAGRRVYRRSMNSRAVNHFCYEVRIENTIEH